MDYGHRVCAACSLDLPRSDFSRNQWSSKGTSNGSRCISCVAEGRSAAPELLPTARLNSATSAVLDKGNPFASGTFRLVARGEYTDGDRVGEPCVAKWFKTGLREESAFFDVDRLVTERAVQLLNQYAHSPSRARGVSFKLNMPQVWTRLPREVLCKYRNGGVKRGPQFLVAGDADDGKRVLVEPFVFDYAKFNSNSGWVDDGGSHAGVIAALSHFTYHVTAGQLVLCDLQGSYADGRFVFTDPVILSRDAGRYGPTDLGPLGISTFFSQHVCSAHCRSDWMTPADVTRYLEVVPGTSMTCRSAAARSVGVMSAIREGDEDEGDDDGYY